MSPVCKNAGAMFVILALLSGCRGPTYEYANVEGKVTLNGKPLAGVIVNFYPVNESSNIQAPMASGTTDETGIYRLSIDGKQAGAVVGPNVAVVRWPVRDRAKPPPVPDVPIPVKYSVVTESPLKFEVKSGSGQTINLALEGF